MTSDFYGSEQRRLQDDFDTRRLADAHQLGIVDSTIDEERAAFIESRDFFFLSTVGADGFPTVSYKGGPVGVVHVLDDRTVAFPSYDGNGMFLSMGNVAATARIGMLFIDFETPQRLRLHATATVSADDPLLGRYPGAELLVRAHVENVFVNCARYIHRHERVRASEYVPDGDGAQPYPAWKRIDLIQPFLPGSDDGKTEAAGGEITMDEYAARLADGTS